MDQMKKCPTCAEMVQHEAKVCRYCRYWFSKNPLDPRTPWFLFTVIGLMILTIQILPHFLTSKISTLENISKDFDPKTSGLVVEETTRVKNKYPLQITGSIKNNGVETWKGVHLELHLLNDKNQIIEILKDVVSGPVSPNNSRKFLFEQTCDPKREILNFTKSIIYITNAYSFVMDESSTD